MRASEGRYGSPSVAPLRSAEGSPVSAVHVKTCHLSTGVWWVVVVPVALVVHVVLALVVVVVVIVLGLSLCLCWWRWCWWRWCWWWCWGLVVLVASWVVYGWVNGWQDGVGWGGVGWGGAGWGAVGGWEGGVRWVGGRVHSKVGRWMCGRG